MAEKVRWACPECGLTALVAADRIPELCPRCEKLKPPEKKATFRSPPHIAPVKWMQTLIALGSIAAAVAVGLIGLAVQAPGWIVLGLFCSAVSATISAITFAAVIDALQWLMDRARKGD